MLESRCRIFKYNINMSKVNTFDQLDEFEKLSGYAKKVLIESFSLSRIEGSRKVLPRHLFMAVLTQQRSISTRLLERLGVDIEETLRSISDSNRKVKPSFEGQTQFSENVKKILVDAFVIASDLGHVYTGTEHLLLALLRFKNLNIVVDLNVAGITYESVKEALLKFATYHQGVFGNQEGIAIDSEIDDDDKETVLQAFSENMNERSEKGAYLPVYGRNDEIERIIHILSRKTKSNPILVGEAGVGKTAVIEGLVQRLNSKDVPISFQDKKIVNLDIAGVLAGSKIRGDIEERILGVIKEASDHPDIILFIDEIHMIIGAGSAGQGSMDIANILKPHLTSGKISVIGATTLNEYQQFFESDSALSRRFQPVHIEEISQKESVDVLKNIRGKLEDFHKVLITDEAIDTAVSLSMRYIPDKFLPDKAIDILDEAAAGKKISIDGDKDEYAKIQKDLKRYQDMKALALNSGQIEKASRLRKKELELEKVVANLTSHTKFPNRVENVVDDGVIRRVVSKLTKVPVEKLGMDALKALSSLKESMQKKIIGQSDALTRIVASIKRAKIGIGDIKKPMASFLFVGPSGVGKTETAKALANEIFGKEDSVIQLDMSEYMEQHSLSKLIGAPPGYVGFQDGGQFTEKIRRNPYSVVLLDEIEKAHPDLLNILLQILDEGQVKDGKGRIVNFRNTIIIMTSNLGVEEILNDDVLGFSLDESLVNDPKEIEVTRAFERMNEKMMEVLKEELRPEFLNRIDSVILFKGLSDSDILKITELEIDKLNSRIHEKNLAVAVSQGAIKYLASESGSEEYGARNVKRKIQELVENPLANLILEQGLVDNKDMVIVRVLKNKSGIYLKLTK